MTGPAGRAETAMESLDRSLRLAAVAAAFKDADEDTLRDWRAETDAWSC
ncbi:hypothetical protein [Mycolicibacterium hodleri]|nr:hypothetical protein [Mycolicibacterium hodleri]